MPSQMLCDCRRPEDQRPPGTAGARTGEAVPYPGRKESISRAGSLRTIEFPTPRGRPGGDGRDALGREICPITVVEHDFCRKHRVLSAGSIKRLPKQVFIDRTDNSSCQNDYVWAHEEDPLTTGQPPDTARNAGICCCLMDCILFIHNIPHRNAAGCSYEHFYSTTA